MLSCKTRPNVLFVICDDLRCDLEGLGFDRKEIMPNLLRLESRGVTFMDAQCNSPLCGPSRASLFSGLYPHTSDNYVFGNWKSNRVLGKTVMMKENFRRSGYKVYGTGKLQHNGQEDYSVYHAFGYPANFGPFPDGGKLWEEKSAHPNLSTLMDTDPEIRIAWEQTFAPLSLVPTWEPDSSKQDGWFLANAPYGSGEANDLHPFRYVSETDRDLMPDERSTQWAIERLRRIAAEGEGTHETPFFLGVGYNRPHTPLYAPQKHFDRFPLERITMPPAYGLVNENLPEITETLYRYPRKRYDLIRDTEARTGEPWMKRWLQAYLACVNFADEQFGILLDALETSSFADNTLIVFTSDNGYHMGEKQALFKNTLWEPATRVPLAVVGPGVGSAGSTCSHAVSLIDLYPTLNELCGLDPHPNRVDGRNGIALEGHSLAMLLQNPDAQWDGSEFAVVALPTNQSTVDKYGPEIGPVHLSLRGDPWRYNLFSNGEEELYNLETDPHETRNLTTPEKVDAEIKGVLRCMKDALLKQAPAWYGKLAPDDWEKHQWEPPLGV